MATVTSDTKMVYVGRELHGRKEIFTSESVITRENVLSVLNKALQTHAKNRADIKYLWDYRRGIQPVLWRQKSVNAEINNRIVVNIANEIVTFKVANFAGEPMQYVSRGSKEGTPKRIETLNSMMMSENKASKDMTLADWMFTGGVGYRLTLRDKAEAFMAGELLDEAPFEVYTLNPMNTFVVKRNDVTRRVVMGVTYVYEDEKESKVLYTVYTPEAVYRIKGTAARASEILSEEVYNFGMVPIVEYPCNPLHMGAFEPVLPLLDAINLTESNRLDGVEQFIQALMVFEGVDVTRDQFLELKDLGAIKLPGSLDGRSQPRVYYLNEQLDQGQTQTLVDAMKQEVYEIVGLPSQGTGNTSDSSNNGAAYIKNGGWGAETRTRETIGMWRESEYDFLRIILKILRESGGPELALSEIEVKFRPNNYEDKLVKVQSFTTLISSGAPPIQAFKYSGLDADPESAAIVYEKYQEEREADLLDGADPENTDRGNVTEPVTPEDGEGDV